MEETEHMRRRDGQTMTGRRALLDEMQNLERQVGADGADQSFRVLAQAIRWLWAKEGHGNVQLSALDHVFGLKFRVDSVVTVGGKNKKK